jgi:ribosome maturation factor RimP
MKTVTEITPVIDAKVRALGYELYGIRTASAGRRQVVRVYIDKPGGITVGECEQASRELSVLLDVENFSARSYSLEVSSPGIDWPLRQKRDYLRVSGRRVVVRYRDEAGAAMEETGEVVDCSDLSLDLETSRGRWSIPLARIERAKVATVF